MCIHVIAALSIALLIAILRAVFPWYGKAYRSLYCLGIRWQSRLQQPGPVLAVPWYSSCPGYLKIVNSAGRSCITLRQTLLIYQDDAYQKHADRKSPHFTVAWLLLSDYGATLHDACGHHKWQLLSVDAFRKSANCSGSESNGAGMAC